LVKIKNCYGLDDEYDEYDEDTNGFTVASSFSNDGMLQKPTIPCTTLEPVLIPQDPLKFDRLADESETKRF
jgi:hypothetical protein